MKCCFLFVHAVYSPSCKSCLLLPIPYLWEDCVEPGSDDDSIGCDDDDDDPCDNVISKLSSRKSFSNLLQIDKNLMELLE